MDVTQTELTITEIYKITFADGAIAYFTSHNKDINYGGNTYQAIPITRTPIRYHTNLQVDKVDISFGLIGVKIGTKELSIPEVIRRDFIRNAHVENYLLDYVALDETKMLFEGWVTGDVTYNAGVITVGVGSILDKLKEKFPKVIYSELCNHQLFSVSSISGVTLCELVKATYSESGVVLAGSDNEKIYADVFSFSGHAEGYWEKGEIKMASGNNDGVSRSILEHGEVSGSGWYIKTTLPFPEDILLYDTFDVWPGCDKTGQTCDEKYQNYSNFFGFEYIPKPEILMP